MQIGVWPLENGLKALHEQSCKAENKQLVLPNNIWKLVIWEAAFIQSDERESCVNHWHIKLSYQGYNAIISVLQSPMFVYEHLSTYLCQNKKTGIF